MRIPMTGGACFCAVLLVLPGCSKRDAKPGPDGSTAAPPAPAEAEVPIFEGPLFESTSPGVKVKLRKIPEVQMAPRPAASETQAGRIKDLIAGLAAMDRPDYGLSGTLSGSAFAPVPGQTSSGCGIFTHHGLRTTEEFKALVALGPDALPFLLDALDDPTPTRISIKPMMPGNLWFGAELHLNPANPFEKAVFEARSAKSGRKSAVAAPANVALQPGQPASPGQGLEDLDKPYTVKVGDVCFVAIGQIVGRSYAAVRYQPSGCIVVNSPVRNPSLCAEVRSIWKADDPWRRLFDSLLTDYSTEGVFNGKSLDGWGFGSSLQCGAALRLLYYFPEETAPLIAQRLSGMDVGKDSDVDGYMRRSVANGVRAEEFLKAVAWFPGRVVRDALTDLFKRAGDEEVLLAVLPAVEDPGMIDGRLGPLIDALPAEEEGPYGRGYHLLTALAERAAETARPVFERYLRDACAQRCHTVCLVLCEAKVSWDLEVLGPLLLDKRTWGWTYPVDGANGPARPLRVCDEAAVTLNAAHPELRFTLAGEHADLDRQIQAIREQLSRGK
jgi:hypothetical protein